MPGPRIIKLVDGEEMISSEIPEHSKTLVHDPRRESLRRRRAAEGAADRLRAENPLTRLERKGR